jgi:hypothetical protein
MEKIETDNVTIPKKHLQITIPIKENYNIDHFNFTFGDFKDENTVMFSLETFILNSQYTHLQKTPYPHRYAYVTFWEFGPNIFYTLSIFDRDREDYLDTSEDEDVMIDDIEGGNNNNNEWYKDLDITLKKLLKKQDRIIDADKRFVHSIIFYDLFCKNKLKDQQNIVEYNFTDKTQRSSYTNNLLEPNHINDIFNYNNTKMLFKQFDDNIYDYTEEQLKLHITSQYSFPIRLLFLKGFFSYKMPVNPCNIFQNESLKLMNDQALNYPYPSLRVPLLENDYNYDLHCLNFVKEEDNMVDVDQTDEERREREKKMSDSEKKMNEEKKKRENYILQSTYHRRIKDEFRKKKMKEKPPIGNIFISRKWSLLSQEDEILKDPILFLREVFKSRVEEIEKCQEMIDKIIYNKYGRKYELEKIISKKKEFYVDSSLKEFNLAQIKYECDETNIDYIEARDNFFKIIRFFDGLISGEIVLNNSVLDEEEKKLYDEIAELRSINIRIKNDETIKKYKSDIQNLRKEINRIYHNWCEDIKVKAIFSDSTKSVVNSWKISDTKSPIRKDYCVIDSDNMEEKEIGNIYRKWQISNICVYFGLKFTYINYMILEHICYTLFNYHIENPSHVFFNGSKGIGKSETIKTAYDTFLRDLIVRAGELYSAKALTTTHVPINNAIYFLDEATVIFSSSETSKKNNDVLNEKRNRAKTVLSSNKYVYTVFTRCEESGDRVQLTICNSIRIGHALTGNIAPKKGDPLTDRLLVDNMQVDYSDIINSLIHTKKLLDLDENFKKTNEMFNNSIKLKQTVLLNYLIYVSTCVFGRKTKPFTDQVTSLLIDDILKNFFSVFKTYDYGPRSWNKVSSHIIGCMFERIFAELFLIKDKSKYGFDPVKGVIVNKINNSVIDKEEVYNDIHIRSYTEVNDILNAINLTNCERINNIEKEVISCLCDKFLKLGSYHFVNRTDGTSLRNYFINQIKNNSKLSFKQIKVRSDGTIYDPNFIIINFGKNKKESLCEIKAMLGSDCIVTLSQIEFVLDGLGFMIHSQIKYKNLLHGNDDSCQFLPILGNNQHTTVQSVRSELCSQFHEKGKFCLAFSVHGLRELFNFKNVDMFDKYKEIMVDSLKSVIFFDKEIFIYDKNNKMETFKIKDEIIHRDIKEDEIMIDVKVKNMFYGNNNNKWSSYCGINRNDNKVKNIHLSKLLNGLSKKNFVFESDIDELSRKIHFERNNFSEEQIKKLQKERSLIDTNINYGF